MNPNVDGPDFRLGFFHAKPPDQERCIFTGGICNTLNVDYPFEFKPAGAMDPYQQFAVNFVQVTARYQVPPILAGLTGFGTASMAATTFAAGRRQRVRCALPFAVSTCQTEEGGPGVPGPPLQEFSCGDLPPFTRSYVFNSQIEDPAVGGPILLKGLSRVDLFGDGDPGPQSDYRDFVQDRTSDWACDTETRVRLSGTAIAPLHKRTDLGPIINGLLGIPSTSGGVKTGDCGLGRLHVIPVIAADEGCPDPNWPYADSAYHPRIVGFVNINFTRINCKNSNPNNPNDDLTAGSASCDDPAQAELCVGGPGDADKLILFAEIHCSAPAAIGHPGQPPIPALSPRLVR
jgi:hypothetical protein